VFSDSTISFDREWDHCTGRQGDKICRVIVVFPTGALPKTAKVTAVKLRVTVPYVSNGVALFTWSIGRYGSAVDNAQMDLPSVAFARADSLYYLKASTAPRTKGAKTITLTTATAADLSAAVKTGAPFTVAIKQTQENVPDQFSTISRYQDAVNRPQLLVTVMYP